MKDNNKKSKRIIALSIVGIIAGLVFIFVCGNAFLKKLNERITSNRSAEEENISDDEIEELDENVSILYADKTVIRGTNIATINLTYESCEVILNDAPHKVYNVDSNEQIGELIKFDDYTYIGEVEISGVPGQAINLGTDFDDNTVIVKVFEEVSDADIDDLIQLENKIRAISMKFENAEGYIDSDKYGKALRTVYSEAEGWLDNNEINDLYIDSKQVCITTNAGLRILYLPPMEGVKSHDQDNPLTISIISPFNGPFSNALTDEDYIARILDNSSKADAFDSIAMVLFSGAEIDFEIIKQCCTNDSFIIWNGHGGYDVNNGSFLELTKHLNKEELLSIRENDYIDCVLFTDINSICVGEAFFNKALPVGCLNGSAVYLGACNSLRDNRMARSLIKKGASVVFGYDNVVRVDFDNDVFDILTYYLFKTDPNSEEMSSYPVEKAYVETINRYPVDPNGAHFCYIGDSDYRLFSDSSDFSVEIKAAIEDKTNDSVGRIYVLGYTLNGVYNEIKVRDHCRTPEQEYFQTVTFVEDLDGDGENEVLVDLFGDYIEPRLGLREGSFHIFNISDNKLVEIPIEGILKPSTDFGVWNYGMTIYEGIVYYRMPLDPGEKYADMGSFKVSDSLIEYDDVEPYFSDELINKLENVQWY